ncbi:MAG TPA: universal stress protein [Ignavibacteria bacterium]|nr:universal stress protein [Ignavibacteria bacterium]
MKKILFPTDFSEASLNSKSYAIEIAKRSGAQVYLLNVYNVTIYDPNMPAELVMETMNEAQKFAKENLDSLSKEFVSQKYSNGKNLDVSVVYKQGLVSDEIEVFCEENNIDLIVMGTTGESGLLDKILGSNTASVLEKVKCPVLAVPAKANFKNIQNVVYASNLTDDDTKEVMQLKDFLQLFDAQLTYLHVCDEDDKPLQNEKDTIFDGLKKEIGYDKITLQYTDGTDVEKGIEDYINSHPVDILVMAIHKRNFFEKIFKRSLTKEMVYHSQIPLYALHIK